MLPYIAYMDPMGTVCREIVNDGADGENMKKNMNKKRQNIFA